MKKILRYISDYFLGTEIHSLFKKERDLYKEVIKNKEDLEKILRLSRTQEIIFLSFYKGIPNVIDTGAIIYSSITKQPPYLLMLGGGLRFFFIPEVMKCKGGKGLEIEFIKGLYSFMGEVSKTNDNIKEVGSKIKNLTDTTKEIIDSSERFFLSK